MAGRGACSARGGTAQRNASEGTRRAARALISAFAGSCRESDAADAVVAIRDCRRLARQAYGFGASVAETDHHDLWQRAALTAALVGQDVGPLHNQSAKLERYVLGMFPDGARVEFHLISTGDLH